MSEKSGQKSNKGITYTYKTHFGKPIKIWHGATEEQLNTIPARDRIYDRGNNIVGSRIRDESEIAILREKNERE